MASDDGLRQEAAHGKAVNPPPARPVSEDMREYLRHKAELAARDLALTITHLNGWQRGNYTIAVPAVQDDDGIEWELKWEWAQPGPRALDGSRESGRSREREEMRQMPGQGLTGWLSDEVGRRAEEERMAEEDRLARRAAYDEWARNYADSGVRVDGDD